MGISMINMHCPPTSLYEILRVYLKGVREGFISFYNLQSFTEGGKSRNISRS